MHTCRDSGLPPMLSTRGSYVHRLIHVQLNCISFQLETTEILQTSGRLYAHNHQFGWNDLSYTRRISFYLYYKHLLYAGIRPSFLIACSVGLSIRKSHPYYFQTSSTWYIHIGYCYFRQSAFCSVISWCCCRAVFLPIPSVFFKFLLSIIQIYPNSKYSMSNNDSNLPNSPNAI